MISINKNYSLNQLRGLVHQQFQKTSIYSDKGFSEEQKQIMEIFNKRIIL